LNILFNNILKLCPQDISVHIIKEYAKCITQQEKYFFISGKNAKIEVDSVFITTGHNQSQNNFPMYSAYPLEISTRNISANDVIGIKGLGLSAIDVITMLTSGNGGFFDKLFILGLPTEGIKFYTFILPRPHIASTFLFDSNKAVDCLIKRAQA